MLFSGSSFLVDYDTAKVRLSLRVYFTFFFLILAAVSDKCSSLRSRLRLFGGKTVKLPLTTGWLDGIAAIKTWIIQRSLPAGWFGLIMILAWFLSVSSDLMVSGLVKTTMIVGRCEFGRGVICNPPPNGMLSTPDRENVAVTVVQQAQNNSITNGGLSGIFRKANTDQYFRADTEDVLGTWECQFTGNDTYPYTANMTDIILDLQSKNRLYDNTTAWWDNGISPAGWNSLTAWSPSQSDAAFQLFNVRVSRETTWYKDYLDRTMSSYLCTMNTPEVEWILVQIQPETTLEEWTQMLHGVLSDFSDNNISEGIVSTLNLITMVGSEGRIPNFKEPLTNTTLDTTQGCLTARAEIPLPVIIVLAIVSFAVVVFFVYWAILQARLHHFNRVEYRQKHRIEDVYKAAPNRLIDWMVYVAQQFYAAEHVGAKDLSNFVLVKDGEGRLKVALDGDFEST